MAKYILTFGFFFGTTTTELFGQNLPSIQLDRPDQTECPFITPIKYIQIENGFTFENTDNNERVYSYPSTLWKYGINGNLELRIISEFVTDKNRNQTITGLTPITLGFKTALVEEKGIIPKTSFIGHLTTSNLGSKKFRTKYIAPSFRFTMQHTVSKTMSLGYNLGVEWNGETAQQTYIYTLTTGISLTDKFGCYGEIYGFIPKSSKSDHRFDCGLTYLINNDLIADASGGFSLTDISYKNYISFGISYRFKATN